MASVARVSVWRVAFGCLVLALLSACEAAVAPPRTAVLLRAGVARPLLARRTLLLRGGEADEQAEADEAEETDEVDDEDAEIEGEAGADDAAEGDAPEVEDPDPDEVAATATKPSLFGLDLSSLRQKASSLLGQSESGEVGAEGTQEIMSTILTVAVFIGIRLALGIAYKLLRQPSADGGTPLDRLGAMLAAGPLGPLVRGWGKLAEFARSPYAGPVVMLLCITSLKMIGGMDQDAVEATEAALAGEEPAVSQDAETDEGTDEADDAAAEEDSGSDGHDDDPGDDDTAAAEAD